MFSKSISNAPIAVAVRSSAGERRASGIRNLTLAIGAFACLTMGSLGVVGHAEARVPASAMGAEADACRAIQSDYDELTAALKRPGLTPQQRAHIQTSLDKITDRWSQECSQFGNISRRVLPPVANIDNAGVGPVGAVDDAGQTHLPDFANQIRFFTAN